MLVWLGFWVVGGFVACVPVVAFWLGVGVVEGVGVVVGVGVLIGGGVGLGGFGPPPSCPTIAESE